jgi:ferric-dicitrate binding protein FerR (iron transport regulator)
LSVTTPRGTVRDVGTRFVARVEPARLDVAVRDGSVSLTRGGDVFAAATGEKLTTAAGSNDVRREAIAIYGAEWAWVERLAPPFEIDGRYLIEFLDWVAAQTGRTLEFADSATERIARDTVLTGSIDLEPMPKLMAVLALTDLDYSIDGGRLVIAAQPTRP